MQTDRAAEIIASPHNIEVFHNEKPVWIKTVDKQKNSAQVIVLGSKGEINVPITELHEIGIEEPFLQ